MPDKNFYLFSGKKIVAQTITTANRFSATSDNLDDLVPVENEIEEHERVNVEFEIMEKALINLGEPCKSLLEAYYLQKQNMQVIAANFGYTNADNAKNQKYKCLMRLKKIFFTDKNGNGDGGY